MPASPDAIFQVASGFMAAKQLFCAAELGVFEALADGPLTADDLAARTGADAHIPANAMVALGLLERDGERYANGEVAQTFLAGRTPADLRPFLRFWNRLSYVNWIGLEDALRGGRPALQDDQAIFSAGVEAITAGPAHALAATYDWSRHSRVLDLGGGTGSFLRAILDAHPGLRATLMELPAVAKLAEGPFEVVTGDVLRDPLPAGHDAIVIANLAHLLSPADNRA